MPDRNPEPERKPESGASTQDYERRALEQVDHLKNPNPSKLRRAVDRAQAPVTGAASKALDTRVGAIPAKAVEGLVSKLNESASWSVRAESVYREFRSAGFDVHGADDIHRLELREVDHVVGQVAVKNTSVAFATGAGAGTLGLPGLAIDIPGLVGAALRAITEYATYYGFDTSNDDEKAFALMLLAASAATRTEDKKSAMRELTKVSRELSGGEPRPGSRHLLDQQLVTKVALRIAGHLSRTKTIQILPVAGSPIAAVADAWFVGRVARMAHPIYRERFLIAKHGPGVAVPVRG
jgi:hypothetical protein